MCIINYQEKNAEVILSDLAEAMEGFNNSLAIYLSHIGEHEMLNPIQTGTHKPLQISTNQYHRSSF
jgi:hypothetical protein